MSGFPYNTHEDHYSPDAQSQHPYNYVHASSSVEIKDDDANIECFEGIPFHFGFTELNADAHVCGLNKSNDNDLIPGTEMTTHMPKRRKKNNSKAAERKHDEKMKADSKIEKEGQSSGTPERGYVHVRARRGQATDSHSLAERVRREKIGERMKLLQSLVPGCDKIAGKAQVLDEIINYVQSLQTQLQILVGKLSILSPYASGYDNNNLEGIVAPLETTTNSICSLEASLSCMMESNCNLLHFADDSQHNSFVSASSSSSMISQPGDQKYFISQGTEFPLLENDVQGHTSAFDQYYWLDHMAQLQ